MARKLTGVAEKNGSTVGLDGEEAELDSGEAEWRRQLDSSTRHRRRLQRRPNSFGTRRLGLAAIGQFR
jgi:hypothetical protein